MVRFKRLERWQTYGGLYAICVVFVFISGCASSMILYPSTQPMDSSGARRIVITSNGKPLEIYAARWPAAPSKPPRIYVLAFVGNASRAEAVASDLAQKWGDAASAAGGVGMGAQGGAEAWAVNYPGYGQSAGPAALSAIAPAALAAYDALRQDAGDRPIYLDGVSLGTTAALYVAARRPVAGMLLTNPPPLARLILGRYGWWNLYLLARPVALQVPADLNSLRNAPKGHCPALFAFADQDEVVPPKYHQMVYEAFAGPKQIIVLHGAGHNTPPSEKEAALIRRALIAMIEGPDGNARPMSGAATRSASGKEAAASNGGDHMCGL